MYMHIRANVMHTQVIHHVESRWWLVVVAHILHRAWLLWPIFNTAVYFDFCIYVHIYAYRCQKFLYASYQQMHPVSAVCVYMQIYAVYMQLNFCHQ